MEKVIRTINLERRWRRARYRDVLGEVAGKDWFEISARSSGAIALPASSNWKFCRSSPTSK